MTYCERPPTRNAGFRARLAGEQYPAAVLDAAGSGREGGRRVANVCQSYGLNDRIDRGWGDIKERHCSNRLSQILPAWSTGARA